MSRHTATEEKEEFLHPEVKKLIACQMLLDLPQALWTPKLLKMALPPLELPINLYPLRVINLQKVRLIYQLELAAGPPWTPRVARLVAKWTFLTGNVLRKDLARSTGLLHVRQPVCLEYYA